MSRKLPFVDQKTLQNFLTQTDSSPQGVFAIIVLLKWNGKSGDILYSWISLAQKLLLFIDFLKKHTFIACMYDSVLIIPRPPCCIPLYTMFKFTFKFPCTNEPILFLRVGIWVSLKESTGAKKPTCESRYVFAMPDLTNNWQFKFCPE